jgi:hypothetical protein
MKKGMTPDSHGRNDNLRRGGIMKLIEMDAHREKRPDFGHFIDRIFWFILTSAVIYCASQMREMGRSVEELNKNMALALYQITETRDRLNKIDSRIDKLEERKR